MQEIRQNLWPDLCTTSILKYLVCCTQSALIHIRRKPVHPRAKNLAGGCSWCVSYPPQLNSQRLALHVSCSIFFPKPTEGEVGCEAFEFMSVCVFTGRFFWIRQNWDGIKDALKPYGCGRFGHSCIIWLLLIYVLLYAEEMCSSFTSRNLLTFMVWWVCLQLLQEGVEEAYFGNCVLLDS